MHKQVKDKGPLQMKSNEAQQFNFFLKDNNLIFNISVCVKFIFIYTFI